MTEDAAFERARSQHKGVMVELYAAWASPCDELAKELRDPRVAGVLDASFVRWRSDVTAGTDADAALLARYKVTTEPALVLVATDGTVVGRVTSYLDAPELAAVVQAAAARLPK